MTTKAGTEEWCFHEWNGKTQIQEAYTIWGQKTTERGAERVDGRSTPWEGLVIRQRSLNSIQKVNKSHTRFLEGGRA